MSTKEIIKTLDDACAKIIELNLDEDTTTNLIDSISAVQNKLEEA